MHQRTIVALGLLLTLSFTSQAQVKGLLNNAKNKANTVIKQNAANPPASPTTPAPAPTTTNEENTTTNTPSAGQAVPAPKKAGTIIFSSEVAALAKKEEDVESKLSSNFSLGAPIYFRAYYAKPLTDYIQQLFPDVDKMILSVHGRFKVRFTIDKNAPYINRLQVDAMQNSWKDEWTSFKGALQATDDEAYLMQDIYRDFVADQGKLLTNGKHTIKMELIPFVEGYPDTKEGSVVATGTFTLNVDDKSVDPNNEKLCLPAAQMQDAALEASIIKAFKAKGWKEQPQIVRITSPKWNIIRHNVTGAIMKRTVDAVVGSTLGDKCIMQTFGFSQDYDGSGYQQQVYLDGVAGQRDVNCGCLGKK